MSTHLIEFKNSRNITLRGILIESPGATSETTVVCVAGFEGLSSTAPKFVNITQKILACSPNSIARIFRYDPTGIGLSDGEYHKTRISTLVDDLTHAMNYLLTKSTKFIFIGHSLGSCVIMEYLNANKNHFQTEKIILLAPALNQYELHRYWYMQENNQFLTWKIFKENFQETGFENYLNSKTIDSCKSHHSHKIQYEFIRLCSQEDYSFKYHRYHNELLHIHGDQDRVVPIQSIKDNFPNQFILHTTDHDLEEPDILQKWTDKALQFIFDEK